MTELVFATTGQFADLHGWSDSYVRRLKREGKLVLDGDRIVVAASNAKLGRILDPARGGDRTGKSQGRAMPTAAEAYCPTPRGGGSASDYNLEAARERRAKAQLAELELMEKTGELVPAQEVDRMVFGMARAGREAIMAMADRLSTQLAAESDAAAVHALLTAEARKVCEHLAASPFATPPQTAAA